MLAGRDSERKMANKTRLGIFSYSYHNACIARGADAPADRCRWLLGYADSLGMDGVQLGFSECDEAVLGTYLGNGERYLEVAMGTWEGDALRNDLAMAARLSARVLRVCLGMDPLIYKRFDEDRPQLMKKLEAAAVLAEEFGVPVAVENHSDYAAWQIAQLVGDLKTPHVGICFDSGNPPSSLEESVDAARAVAPYAMATHLRDFQLIHADYGLRYEGVPLGDGVVDVPEVVRILRGEGSLDTFTLESAVRADPAKSLEDNLAYEEEGARRSVAYAREVLGL